MDSAMPTNLQQTGVDALSTGDPQQVAPSGLQPQASTSLQPTSNQSIEAIQAIDNGTEAIQLNTISNTTTTTVPVASTPKSYTHFAAYGAVAILCGAILVYMVYNLVRKRS